MTETLKALDAITTRVLGYRPKDKGAAATKMRKQIEKAEIEGSESEITEHDDEDDEEDEDRYALSYECPCGNTWQDRWSCAVDDECDECGTVCQATIVEDE